ncbi:MAG: hypothetical protein ACI4MV_06955 [Christensenellales bacterium]
MRVFNQAKTQELTVYDLNKGRLVSDTVITVTPAVAGQEEIGHYETIAEYSNGGKDVAWVVDQPFIESKPEVKEVEEIQLYIPFTVEEQAQYDQAKYESLVESKIRQKYTLSQELAILRQKETKSQAYQAYFDYCEECKSTAKSEIAQ